ncbi:MAG: type II secretion system protein GspN [Thermodesulfobacteriota bacterium]|nr:type II secretion system protein GspN [Thermodesulfobacteriota bacterium]
MDSEVRKYPFWVRLCLVLFGFLCVALFCFIRFPYDTLKDRIEDVLSSSLGVELALGHLHPGFPMNIVADDVAINSIPVADFARFRPGISGLLQGRAVVFYNVIQDQSKAEGMVGLSPGDSAKPVHVLAHLEDVDVGAFRGFMGPHGEALEGLVDADLDLTARPGRLYRASGDLSAVWKTGKMPLLLHGVPLDSIGFEDIRIKARMDKGMIIIETAQMNGDISGSLRGRVHLRPDVSQCRLNLTGEVRLPPGLSSIAGIQGGKDGLRFSLRGTPGSPRFKILK